MLWWWLGVIVVELVVGFVVVIVQRSDDQVFVGINQGSPRDVGDELGLNKLQTLRNKVFLTYDEGPMSLKLGDIPTHRVFEGCEMIGRPNPILQVRIVVQM